MDPSFIHRFNGLNNTMEACGTRVPADDAPFCFMFGTVCTELEFLCLIVERKLNRLRFSSRLSFSNKVCKETMSGFFLT